MITNEQIELLKRFAGSSPDSLADALRAAIDTLEKLPATRDGVRVSPMIDEPWVVQPSGHVNRGHAWANAEQLNAGYRYDQVSGRNLTWFINVSDCYSTRAAAEAAPKENNP